MKKILSLSKFFSLLVVVITIATLSSCRTTMPIGEQGGRADVGYLIFTSEKQYVNKPVDVKVNNGEASFIAKPIKPANSKSKGTSYQLSTGKKSIIVTKDGETLYKGVIMLYPQETKVITLK